MTDRTLRALAPAWPLGVILTAALLAYAPALTSPFWLDDYFYLVAARDLSTREYLQTVFTPWSEEPLLPFTRDFWRPLAFTWFELLHPLPGDDPLPYHLLVLAGHLAAVALTWALAARLDPRRPVRALAAGIVALHPGPFQAVAWVSSVNSLALPLALAAWLAFLQATKPGNPPRWSRVTLAAVLLALGAMTREGAWVVVPILAAWHVAVTARWNVRSPDTWLPLLPFALLAALYVMTRTRLFTEPLANRAVFDWGDHTWTNYRVLLEYLVLPFRESVFGLPGWKNALQALSLPVVPLLTIIAAVTRRWAPAILLAGALLSILAVAPNRLGAGPRYLYFTTPWLALGLAILAADLLERLPRRVPRPALIVAGLLATFVAALALYDRVSEWNEWGPGQQRAWLDALRTEYPALPPGTTLVAAGNVPGWLTIFEGVSLAPAVRWYYPEAAGARYVPPGEIPTLGPGEILFVAP